MWRLVILGFKIHIIIWCNTEIYLETLYDIFHCYPYIITFPTAQAFPFKNHVIIYSRALCFDRRPFMFLLYFRRTITHLISISSALTGRYIILRIHKCNNIIIIIERRRWPWPRLRATHPHLALVASSYTFYFKSVHNKCIATRNYTGMSNYLHG